MQVRFRPENNRFICANCLLALMDLKFNIFYLGVEREYLVSLFYLAISLFVKQSVEAIF